MKDTDRLLQEKYQGQETSEYFTDCERLTAGEPLAYIIGSIPFLTTTIHLPSRPLIPRPETEYWTAQAITEIRSHHQPKVLDLCAGSGCIGVGVAASIATAKVCFAELDPAHLPTIAHNLAMNLIENDRCQIVESDLFSNVTSRYNYILSNPPYIDPALDRATASVKTFEPNQALYGGTAGLDLINQIISISPNYLLPAGQLWLEHEPEQSAAIQDQGHQAGFVVTTHQDQYDTERFSVLVLQ